MTLLPFLAIAAIAIISVDAASISHSRVQPFKQPVPVTISEKAGVKFKPLLEIRAGCVSFPAVNAEGQITGGLKGTGGTQECDDAPLGSQVYGRSAWHNDAWAIMYAWYFPKGFQARRPFRRHDWASVVVWIDNPAVEAPKVLGVSTSQSDSTYNTFAPLKQMFLANGTTPKFYHSLRRLAGGDPFMDITILAGDSHDLIMWDQLPDDARIALETTDFGDAKVPFIDSEFTTRLDAAWLY